MARPVEEKAEAIALKIYTFCRRVLEVAVSVSRAVGPGAFRTLLGMSACVFLLAGCDLFPKSEETTKSAIEAPELLVVFVQDSGSAIGDEFATEDLPEIQEFAAIEKIPLHVVNVAEDGAPPEVTLTPLIAYVNHRGHAIYQGRYRDLNRLRNFVQTFRAVSQEQPNDVRKGVFVWRSERSQVIAPLKITPLSGALPEGYDVAALQQEIEAGLGRGFETLELADEVSLGRGDRTFYVDLHPYVGDDGAFHVTVELFSQFHCTEALFTNQGSPISGSWDDRGAVYSEVGRVVEHQLLAQFSNPALGDGFDVVPAGLPNLAWTSLAAKLPPAREQETVTAELPEGGRWHVLSPATDRRPDVVFRFANPLEFYSGSASEAAGELLLPADGDLGSGRIVVNTASVTMGHPDLDETIHGTKVLNIAEHPDASFVIEEVVQEGSLGFGEMTPLLLAGSFSMRGVTLPLSVRAQLEPIVAEGGQPQLLLSGRFRLQLGEPFGIDGPPGPEPARDTLHFDFLFRLARGGDATATAAMHVPKSP